MADKFLDLTGLSHFLSKVKALINEKAPSVSPTLKFAIKASTDANANPHAEFRTMGNSPNKSVGFAVYDENGAGSYYDLIKGDGTRYFATVPEVNAKAPIDSPIFTTAAFAPNPGITVDSTRLATTHYTNQMFEAFETPKTIYSSNSNMYIRKFGKLIVTTFNNVSSLPTKSTIDSEANGEEWLPTAPPTQYFCLWDYSNKRQVYLTVNSSGMTAVRTVDQTTVTNYRLYGTLVWITS